MDNSKRKLAMYTGIGIILFSVVYGIIIYFVKNLALLIVINIVIFGLVSQLHIRQLKISNDRICLQLKKSKNKSKALYNSIKHEISTPLTNILGYSEAIQEHGDSSESAKRYASIIEKNSKKLMSINDDFFQILILEDLVDTKLEVVDICEFMRMLLIDYISELEEKNIKYVIKIPDDEIFVSIDVKLFKKAVRRIIENTIRYNDKGKNTTLQLQISHTKNKVKITLADDGKGIPAEYMYDIFKPFSRPDKARNSKLGGAGLGLSVTKKIIEKLDGSIDLNTDNHDGIGFDISFRKYRI